MSKEERKVPELRFKGFHDDWEQRKLKDILIVNSGKDYKHLSPGPIPVYGTGGYMLSVNDKLSNQDGIGLGRKGTINKPQYLNSPFWTVDTLFYLTSRDNNSLLFQYYVAQDINWLKFDESTGVPSLSKKTIENITKFIPTHDEQIKNGEFFKKLDRLITLHQRKINILETLRKVYLNVMFTSKRDSTPRLRFKNFAEVWEQRKLKTITERVRGNDGRMDLPTLTISAGKGWMDQRERFSGNIAGKEQKNYTLLSKNELSYNKGNSKLAKYGVVFKLKNFEEALVPRVYHSFKTTYEANPDFIEYVFATKNPDRELAKLITSGARMDGLLNINFNDFMDIKISIPDKEEQTKISRFLGKVDNIINLQQRKLHRLNKIKQVYLSKMFI